VRFLWFLLTVLLLAGNASAVGAPLGQIKRQWDALAHPESLLLPQKG
jgi:hypothetical protein